MLTRRVFELKNEDSVYARHRQVVTTHSFKEQFDLMENHSVPGVYQETFHSEYSNISNETQDQVSNVKNVINTSFKDGSYAFKNTSPHTQFENTRQLSSIAQSLDTPLPTSDIPFTFPLDSTENTSTSSQHHRKTKLRSDDTWAGTHSLNDSSRLGILEELNEEIGTGHAQSQLNEKTKKSKSSKKRSKVKKSDSKLLEDTTKKVDTNILQAQLSEKPKKSLSSKNRSKVQKSNPMASKGKPHSVTTKVYQEFFDTTFVEASCFSNSVS